MLPAFFQQYVLSGCQQLAACRAERTCSAARAVGGAMIELRSRMRTLRRPLALVVPVLSGVAPLLATSSSESPNRASGRTRSFAQIPQAIMLLDAVCTFFADASAPPSLARRILSLSSVALTRRTSFTRARCTHIRTRRLTLLPFARVGPPGRLPTRRH